MLAVATANVVLGVWRPRFIRRSYSSARESRPSAYMSGRVEAKTEIQTTAG